jgi:D-threo-aldose 1-dehydrogenase
MTTRFTFQTRLRAGSESEYERIHSTTPVELDAVLRRAGARFWRIERSGLSLLHYVEVDDVDTFTTVLDSDETHLQWGTIINPLLTDEQPERVVVRDFDFGRGNLIWELPVAPVGRLSGRGLNVGPLSLGCAQLGNLYQSMSDAAADAIVDAAWAGGIRHFDTAPHYGLGLSEQRLGRALRGHPREQVIVSTKVGRMLDANTDYRGELDTGGFEVPARLVRRWDFSADGVRRCLDESLERLGLDHIDLVLIHDPEEHLANPGQAMREGFPALAQLRDEGIIRAIGVGTKSTRSLLRFVEDTDIDAVMLAGRYTLVNQDALSELLPACEERSIDVLNAGVFNSGVLAHERPAVGALFDYGAATRSLIDRVNQIADVCETFDTSVPRIALEFAAAHPAVRAIVFGADSPQQVVDNLDLVARAPAPRELWTELVSRELLSERAAEAVLAVTDVP